MPHNKVLSSGGTIVIIQDQDQDRRREFKSYLATGCNRQSYLLTVSRPCSGGTARRIQDSLLVSGVHQPSLKETFITSECLILRTCYLLARSAGRTRKVGGFSNPESWAPLVQSNSSPYRDSSKLFRVKSSDLYRLQMLESQAWQLLEVWSPQSMVEVLLWLPKV